MFLKTNKSVVFYACVFFMFFCLGHYIPRLSFYYRHFKTPTVTIIMSTYNRAPIVSAAVESALEQTYKDFEFIIVDDGSTDNTAAVLEKYARLDPRLIILTNPSNNGLIAGLNKGLAHARGKYIARIDDDDKMLPDRLEKQVAYMQTHPDAAVLATGYYYMKHGRRVSRHGCPSPSDQVYVNMHFANGIAHPTTMFRTSFFKENALAYNKEFPHAEDYKLWQDVLWAGGQIECLPDPLIEYAPSMTKKSYAYSSQKQSFDKVRLLFLNKFFDATEQDLSLPACTLVKKLVSANNEKNILDKKRLADKLKTNCRKSGDFAYFLEHPDWTDALIQNADGTFRRFSDAETAARITKGKDAITVYWTHRKPEKFKCRQNICTFIP